MTRILVAYAPYVSLIIAGIVSVATFLESKRKTRHDELRDLYEEIKAENDRLKRENDRLRKEKNRQ